MIRRLRRACLVVPAIDRRKVEKAANIDVDEVVLDLEDAVPASLKGEARAAAVAAVTGLRWRAATVAVRVNAFDSSWFVDDIAAIGRASGAGLAAIVVPKVESAAVVQEAARLLDDVSTGAVGLEAQIETALGLVRVESIAESSSRLEALIFGAGDYAASIDLPMMDIGAIDSSYPGDQWAYPRARIAVAAHAFGLDAIDSPFAAFRDLDGLRESAARARALGFTGKWAIHPDQVGPCTEAYSTSPSEVAAAERTLAALEAAETAGKAAVAERGSMIDEASRRQAERVLARRLTWPSAAAQASPAPSARLGDHPQQPKRPG